jgi:outer membrane lipoprotein-sorting protein
VAAVRDPVPLPRPNPFVTASAADPQSSEPSGLRKLFGKKPKKSSGGPSPFTSDQQVALANITDYFNSFRTMQGEFVQVGPRGEQSEGVFVISKPGKVRFHYKPPVKLDVIADGRSIAVRDNKANTQDLYPLSKTPLRYLLAENVDLTSSKIVDGVKEDRDLISVLIEERTALVEGKLTLIFDRQSYELRQWIVTDAQGLNTSVAIFNTVTGKKPDPALFKIYLTPKTSKR